MLESVHKHQKNNYQKAFLCHRKHGENTGVSLLQEDREFGDSVIPQKRS